VVENEPRDEWARDCTRSCARFWSRCSRKSNHIERAHPGIRGADGENRQTGEGVRTQIALTYVLTLDDPHRLPKSREVGCFLGLRPGRRGVV
jgi:hypothetical protein